jgi:hypothetical protein
MSDRELVKISIRVDKKSLDRLKALLGIPEDSKVIRACMYFTLNVALNLFGGNLLNMFKRKKDNEELALYEKEPGK